MSIKLSSIRELPKQARIISAYGYRKNGIGMSLYRYKVDNKEFTAWIPMGGDAV